MENIPLLASTVNVEVKLDSLPLCPKCSKGALLPMQDESRSGAIYIKGWVCNNCYHSIAFKSGELYKLQPPMEKGKEY